MKRAGVFNEGEARKVRGGHVAGRLLRFPYGSLRYVHDNLLQKNGHTSPHTFSAMALL